MEKVAIILRFAQLYSHMAHNLVSGQAFFQDHDFLGGIYPEYEKDFDDVVERMIGLDMKPDLVKINSSAVDMLKKSPFTDMKGTLVTLLKVEKMLCSTIEKEILPNPMSHPHGGKDALSQGTVQLLGEICNKSEVRQYKMKQRQ